MVDYTAKKFYLASRDYPFSWTEPKDYVEVLETTWLGLLRILTTHNSWYETIGLASLERRRITGHVSPVEYQEQFKENRVKVIGFFDA